MKNNGTKINKKQALGGVMKLCECGCGQKVKPGRKFRQGHNRKSIKLSEEHKQKIGDAQKGRKCTEETKQAIKKSNLGKKRTEKTKKNISANHVNYSGENNPNYGKKMSEEQKQLISENCPDRTGENNPNWEGGLSFGKYCYKFNDELKERIREYFGRCCYIYGKNEKNNGQKLSIHHVNFDKMVCCNNTKPLFVPLCISCHAKTNYNRDKWEEFFTVSLEYLTQGECFYTQEEMMTLK